MTAKTAELTNEDLQTLQTAMVDLYSDLSRATLGDRIVRFAQAIVTCAHVQFDKWDGNGVFQGTLWGTFGLVPTDEEVQVYVRYAHQNPVYVETVQKRRLDPILLTDFMNPEDFVETELYRQFQYVSDSKFQLAVMLWVSSDFLVSVMFWDGKQDFSERDRLMLATASPHIINAIRNSSELDHLTMALETKNSGVLGIDGAGRIQYVSDFVERISPKYFESRPEVGALLYRKLKIWLGIRKGDSDESADPSKPFELENSFGELSVRVVPNGNEFAQTLLFEERRRIEPKQLEALNLTKREAQVLFWIAQGKTDKDVASILRISHLTIKKHLQNIYIKLGVETRTSAMLRALEVI